MKHRQVMPLPYFAMKPSMASTVSGVPTSFHKYGL